MKSRSPSPLISLVTLPSTGNSSARKPTKISYERPQKCQLMSLVLHSLVNRTQVCSGTRTRVIVYIDRQKQNLTAFVRLDDLIKQLNIRCAAFGTNNMFHQLRRLVSYTCYLPTHCYTIQLQVSNTFPFSQVSSAQRC